MHPLAIWNLQKLILARLLSWSRFSVIAGLGLLPLDPFWHGVGLQAIGWGVIDALIAILARRSLNAKLVRPEAAAPETQQREARNLQRLLWLNTGLDILYVLGGLWLAYRRGAANPKWRGHGWGIILQGGFLFLFDLYHALLIAKTESRA